MSWMFYAAPLILLHSTGPDIPTIHIRCSFCSIMTYVLFKLREQEDVILIALSW